MKIEKRTNKKEIKAIKIKLMSKILSNFNNTKITNVIINKTTQNSNREWNTFLNIFILFMFRW